MRCNISKMTPMITISNTVTIFPLQWHWPTSVTLTLTLFLKVAFSTWSIMRSLKAHRGSTRRLVCGSGNKLHSIACRRKYKLEDLSDKPWAPSQYKDHLLRYMDIYHKSKTVMRPPYLYNRNLYTGKMASLYWDTPLVVLAYAEVLSYYQFRHDLFLYSTQSCNNKYLPSKIPLAIKWYCYIYVSKRRIRAPFTSRINFNLSMDK